MAQEAITQPALDLSIPSTPLVPDTSSTGSDSSTPPSNSSSSLPRNMPPTPLDGGALSRQSSQNKYDEEHEIALEELPKVPIIPPRRVTVPRANCTHIVVDILRSDAACDLCGKVPSFGWLYHCQQDALTQEQGLQRLLSLDGQIFIDASNTSFIEQLEQLELSQSVITQFKQGTVYSEAQIEKLKEQKTNLRNIIRRQLVQEREPWNNILPAVTAETNMSVHPNVTVRSFARHESTLLMVHRLGKLRRRSPTFSKCKLKCCHTCRPYFRDRSFLSFDSVFANEIEPVTEIDRWHDVRIVRNLGLRLSPPILYMPERESGDTSSSGSCASSSNDSDDSDGSYNVDREDLGTLPVHAISRQGTLPPNNTPLHHTPISTPHADALFPQTGLFMKESSRSSSMHSEHNFRSLGPSPTGPRPTLPFEAEVEDFDLGLQSNPRSKGSFDLVRDAGIEDEDLHAQTGRTTSSCISSSSSIADEVAVDGGLALTEEALETHIPDLITQA